MFELKKSKIKTKSITNKELSLPKKYSKTFSNSIFYSVIEIYNDLNVNLRSVPDFQSFLNGLRKM